MSAYKKYCQIFNNVEESYEIVREGKPHFRLQEKRADIYFSVSHSGEYTLVAVSKSEVGIDIQKHDKKNIKEAGEYLFGQDLAESEIYDRYAAGEAHKKYSGKDLLIALKEDNNAKNYYFIKGYSLAIESKDYGVYFMEI